MPGQPKQSADGHANPDYPLQNVENYHPHDVLCGRGGGTNNHVGNENWRNLIAANKRLYISLPKRQKMLVAQSIVKAVRAQNPPGRFLQKDRKTGLYCDIGDQKAHDKTSQALREGAPEIREVMRSEKKLVGMHVAPGGNAAFNTMTNYIAMNMINNNVNAAAVVGTAPQSHGGAAVAPPHPVTSSYPTSTIGTNGTSANSDPKPFQIPGSVSPAQIPSLPPMMAPSSPNVYAPNIDPMQMQMQRLAQQPQQQQQQHGPVPGSVGSSGVAFPGHQQQQQQGFPSSMHQQQQIPQQQQQQQRGPVSQQPRQTLGPAAPAPTPFPASLPTAVGASDDSEIAKMFEPPPPSKDGGARKAAGRQREVGRRGGEGQVAGDRAGAGPSSQPPPAAGNAAAPPTATGGAVDGPAEGDGHVRWGEDRGREQQPTADKTSSNSGGDPLFVGAGFPPASAAPPPDGTVDFASAAAKTIGGANFDHQAIGANVRHHAMAPPAPRSPRKAHFAPPVDGHEHGHGFNPLPTNLETEESMTLKDFLLNSSFRSTDKKSLIDMSDDEDNEGDMDQRAASRTAQLEKLKAAIGSHDDPLSSSTSLLGRDPSIALTEFSLDDMSIGMPLSRGVSRASQALGAYAGDLSVSGDIDMTTLDRDLSLALSDMSLSRAVSGVSVSGGFGMSGGFGGFGMSKDDSGLTLSRARERERERERIDVEYLNRGPSLAFEWSNGGANLGRPSATAMNHAFVSDINGGFAVSDEKEGTTE